MKTTVSLKLALLLLALAPVVIACMAVALRPSRQVAVMDVGFRSLGELESVEDRAAVRSIHIGKAGDVDLSCIKGFENLVSLRLGQCSNVTGFGSLQQHLLEELHLVAGMRGEPIAKRAAVAECYFPRLRSLSIEGGTVIAAVEQLPQAPNLEYLSLARTRIGHLGLLRQRFPELKKLCVQGTPIRSFEGVPSGLLELRAAHCLELESLCDLDGIGLVDIDLSSSRVADGGYTQNWPRLKRLDLSYTAFKDAKSLLLCPSLVQVDLCSTNVASLRPLLQLRSLGVLDLSLVSVDDEEVRLLREANSILDISM